VMDQIGLVLPTSICSGQIASLIAKKLNEELCGEEKKVCVSKFYSLPHTEGCGATDGASESGIYRRTVLGHLVSPLVKYCVLLEHGCEKTHNAYLAHHMSEDMGLNNDDFGWASVQLDGGIDAVTEKVRQMFIDKLQKEPYPKRDLVPLKHLRVAFLTPPGSEITDELAHCFADLLKEIAHVGGLVVVPQNSAFLSSKVFLNELLDHCPTQVLQPSIGYGQKPIYNGFHIMQTLSVNWVECITGLGATGIELMVTLLMGRQILRPTPSHPIVPLIRIAFPGDNASKGIRDALESYDVTLSGETNNWPQNILKEIVEVASHQKQPKQIDHTDFQICRGPLGISM